MSIKSIIGKTFNSINFNNLLHKMNTTKDYKTVIAQHLKNNPEAQNKRPFCHIFWEDIVDLNYYKTRYPSVEHHGHLNGINHHLTTGANPKGLKEPFFATGITPEEMIQITDAQFKVLPKTTEPILAYRCIGEKPEFFKLDYARYQKSLNVKKGDTVIMPEYAYSTPDINYAKIYLPDNKGILYEIEYDIGSRISRRGTEIVAPRGSRYECLDTREQDGIKIIRLKYIQPLDYMN